jgi:HK97 family phage major capsid protein
MKTVKELRQERAEKIAGMTRLNVAAEGEERDLTEAEKVEYDGLKTAAALLAERIARLEEAQELEEDVTRSQGTKAQGEKRGKAPAYNKTRLGDSEARALAHFARTGDASGLGEWRAANDTIGNETTAADGGYAVPTGHYSQIIARRDEKMLASQLGVMRIPGKGLTVNVPVDGEGDVEFAATAEQDDNYAQTYTRDMPAIGQVAMTLAKRTKKIPLTEELLEDEDSNLLAFLSDYAARAMASDHNGLLLTELRTGGTAGLTLDSASTIGATEIPELVYKLADEYADEAAWIMKRATEGLIRGLQGDSFLFNPNPAGSDQGRREIWGFPVYNSTSASTIAASAKSLILLNPQFVGMREGNGFSVLRDPYTTDGIVYLKYKYRVVYKVLQAEAVVYATHPTA